MKIFDQINVQSNFNWTCPHCSKPQIVTQSNSHIVASYCNIGKPAFGSFYMTGWAIRCLDSTCNDVTMFSSIHQATHDAIGNLMIGSELASWGLMPESSAKVQPGFIPAPLREDYAEACRIRLLSPKASATLSRRCLQGMIRDFCSIARGTLNAEIAALRSALEEGKAPAGVTEESIEAIDHVRKVGNIGAHMEKDINLIVDVDPGEAQALIELIEMLFDEWYVSRQKRQERLARVAAIAAEKSALIAQAKASSTGEPT